MRQFIVYINNKPVRFQVTLQASVRFAHLYEKDVSDGTQIEIQNWDKRNTLQRKAKIRPFTADRIF